MGSLLASLGKGSRPAFVVVLLLVLIGSLSTSAFPTANNAFNILRQAAPLGVLAIGQTLVLIAGGIDLSVGMLIGLVVPLGALLMAGDNSMIAPALAAMAGVGIFVGLLNGVLVAAARVHPFVLTFGMMALLQGITFLLTDYRTIGKVAPPFAAFFAARTGLPTATWVLAGVTLIAAVLMQRTRFGRHLIAIGSDSKFARQAGIKVGALTIVAYTLSGLLAAVAGMLVLGRLQAGYPLAGTGYELQAIVAAILGGAAFAGGQGSVAGAVAGAFVLALIANLLNLLGVSAHVQQIVMGTIIIAVVGMRAVVGRNRFTPRPVARTEVR